MKHIWKKLLSLSLAVIMAVQLLPLQTGAVSAMQDKKAGDVLFQNEEKDRLFVSETEYPLAPGITEYVTYSNERDGQNQNIDYFCEVDLSQAKIMTGYAGMENILENQKINWRMQTVSGQVKDTQSYFTRSKNYADYTIAAAINADYYNMATGQPNGLLLINGKVYNQGNREYYFGIKKDDGKAVISDDHSDAALNALSYAVAGGALLVKDGKVNVTPGGRNVTYTAIGIKPDGTVVSMVCYGQSYPISCGYTAYEVAQMMKARGCQTAIMLDGSGSSTFVSRREGDKEPQTRNHPSDGQERQVSSSIFFISQAKADGTFVRAAITPANEVYTPNSTVTFTAAGADSSGAAAPLPAGLTWTVDGKYGTIDSATGKFTSNGTTGDVTVYLYQGGKKVGETTITIANPDQITFAESAVSMGKGDTGNLGLRVYYQQREVHYHDGDLKWDIQPTQYSRKEYVNSTYNYHYKGTSGAVRTDPHPMGITTTMAPPTRLLDHTNESEIKGLKGVANGWIVIADGYENEGWIFAGHKFKVVTETESEQLKKLSVGEVMNNALTINPVYTGADLSVPEHELTETEKGATAITATVTVSSTANDTIQGSVTLNACKEPNVALDFETENAKIFHGLTQGGASDFWGQFENGKYTAFATSKNEKNLKDEGYDVVCVSYDGRQSGNPQVGTATFVNREDGYPVRFGDHSLKVDYKIPGNPNGTDGICFGPTEEIDLSALGNPSKVGIWVYIPKNTPNLWMRLRYRDGSGNTSQVDFSDADISLPNSVARNADDGWHYFEADISHLQTPITIPAGMAVRVMYCSASQQSAGAAKAWASPIGWVKCKTDDNGNIILVDRNDERLTKFTSDKSGQFKNPTDIISNVKTNFDKYPIPDYLATFDENRRLKEAKGYSGTLYFDNLTFVYGSTTEDKVNPVIDSVTVNQKEELRTGMKFDSSSIDIQATYSDSVETDRNNTGVAYAALYVDGRKIDCEVNSTSELRAGLKLANGDHAIKISVVDGYGNETIKEYKITVNDPNGEGAPIKVTAREASAVLGKTVTLDFTPRDRSVTSMTAEVKLPKAFANEYSLTDAQGTAIAATYNSATEILSFQVDGEVNSGPMATLTVKVPTDAVTGSNFSCSIHGNAGENTFSDTVTLPISAPYTVSAGTMVVGLKDTCYFLITHSASGLPAHGVKLYQGEKSLGTSDKEGKVFITPNEEQTTLTVTAKDSEGGVSSALTASVYLPKGKDDGTPTYVWCNAANSADSLNVGWLAEPTKAGNCAQLRLAESREAVENGTVYTGTCQLMTFTDNAAAYVCGAKTDGLKSGTTYYYQVGDGTHWSEIQSFTTGYANTDMKAVVFGDLQESNNTTLTEILKDPKLADCDLAIQTGDLVDNGGNYGLWDSTLKMLDPIKFGRLFAVGNHEQDGSGDPNTTFYNQGDSNYYSAVYGNTFVATLSFNGFTQEALAKLVSDAKASNATWKLLVMHQPVYYTNAIAGISADTQKQIYTAAQEAGIDVVLAGHDHSYARTEPLYDGKVDNEKGITYFICGSLGEKSYTITDNPEFYFAKVNGDYNAIYLTLATTGNELNIQTYDFANGKAELLDSFTKTKNSEHSHSYKWDGGNRLTCECGYNVSRSSYTGYADYTVNDKSGKVYFNAGKLMTGVFAVGKDVVHHAGEDGLIHNSETINTAKCWEDGNLGCWCKDCNKFFQMSETRRQGHLYDENHVCTRKVFNTETFTWETCGQQGKDISTLDIKLAYQYGFYDGEEKKPAVTVKDGDYELKPQSTYGDYMPYWDNNTNVGTATVRIEGYDDGPYYGKTSLTFQIVPQNLKAEDFKTELTANSVRLTWKEVPGATQYIVYQNVDGKWTRLGIVDQPEYTVTGVDQGEYQFRVRPFAEVDGVNYYSTKNSPIVTATLDSGALQFALGSKVERTYGDEKFTNTVKAGDGEGTFAYSSKNEKVAKVDATTGEVTICGAGSTVISATKGDVVADYRLVVAPKTVELKWNVPESQTYNGKNVNVTAEIASGLLPGDDCTVTVSGGNEKDAGTHTAKAVSVSNSNYALPQECAVQYTILPVELHTLVWSNTELTYTGKELAPKASAEENVVAGDTVTFAVPTATEVGTYVVSAVSENSNYVVADDANTCPFTIAMPEIKLTGAENDQLTWYLQGTTIFVSGVTSQETITVSVAAKLAEGQQSASAEVSCGQKDGSVVMGGITYTVNAASMVKSVNEISFADGTTEVGVLPEDASESLKAAATAENNGIIGLNASLAAEAEKLVKNALGETEAPANGVVVTTYGYIDVVEYVPEKSYTVKITPRFAINGKDEAEIAAGMIQNDWLSAPVEVKLTVPGEINLDLAKTYIRQTRADGSSEYIKPSRIDGQTVFFNADELCTFEIVNDSRTARITFPVNDGMQTIVYGLEDIGAALPTVTAPDGKMFTGWKIGESVYTVMTEELLNRAAESEMIQAEPVFQSNSQGGGGSVSGGSVGGNAPATGTVTNADGSKTTTEITPDGTVVKTTIGTDGSVKTEATIRSETVKAAQKADAPITIPVEITAGKNSTDAPIVSISIPKSDGQVKVEIPVTNAVTGTIAVRVNADGSEEIIKTAISTMNGIQLKVEGNLTIKIVENSKIFADTKDHWSRNAVDFVASREIFYGVGNDCFGVSQTMTRGMVNTVLARLSGVDTSGGANWYDKGTVWAVENGISDGTNPTGAVTREQLAAMLYRFVGSPEVHGKLTAADANEVSAYARDAMIWAMQNGIIFGVGDNCVNPGGNAERAQVAAMLARYIIKTMA